MSYRINEQETVLYFVENENNVSQYLIKMNPGDNIKDVNVTFVMNNCPGHPVSSNGECNYGEL